jgi:hypothetical protein
MREADHSSGYLTDQEFTAFFLSSLLRLWSESLTHDIKYPGCSAKPVSPKIRKRVYKLQTSDIKKTVVVQSNVTFNQKRTALLYNTATRFGLQWSHKRLFCKENYEGQSIWNDNVLKHVHEESYIEVQSVSFFCTTSLLFNETGQTFKQIWFRWGRKKKVLGCLRNHERTAFFISSSFEKRTLIIVSFKGPDMWKSPDARSGL